MKSGTLFLAEPSNPVLDAEEMVLRSGVGYLENAKV